MIQQANRSAAAANTADTGATAPTNTQQQQQPGQQGQQQQQQPLPLIRLRVDYTGFGTINSQRFGQKYVGKVCVCVFVCVCVPLLSGAMCAGDSVLQARHVNTRVCVSHMCICTGNAHV